MIEAVNVKAVDFCCRSITQVTSLQDKFIFTCGDLSQGQYILYVYTFCSLETVVKTVFICRFQAQDLEVQLSDELAGSLRRLKVLYKLLELCLAHPL